MNTQIDAQAAKAAPIVLKIPRPGKRAAAIALGLLALLIVLPLLARLMGGSANSFAGPTYYEYAAPPTSGNGATTTDGVGKAPDSQTADWDHKIIRNGTMSLQVQDVSASLNSVRDAAAQVGGFVVSSNSQYSGDDLIGTITIQVPAAQFDAVLATLRGLGIKVLNESTTSQDVTEEFVDLQAQLKNLQAQEDQLRALMAKAETVDETLSVQRELGSVRGQIEQIQGRINYINRRAEMSNLTVTLTPKPVAPRIEPAPGWQPLSTAEQAWNTSLRFLAGMGDALIALLVFCWWLLPLLLVAWLLLRGRFARRGANA